MTTGEKAAVVAVSVLVVGGLAVGIGYILSDSDVGKPGEKGAFNPFLGDELTGGKSVGKAKPPAAAGTFGPVNFGNVGGRVGPGPNTPPTNLVPPPKPRTTGPIGVI